MKIGFIGLGIMGRPMAKNLLRAGHELSVCSRSQAAVDELVRCGAQFTPYRQMAERCEAVLTMLPNSPQVKQVVLGPEGIGRYMGRGQTYIDMSSISPLASREVAAELERAGVSMLDAPVSGGEPKAVDGTLSFMVGGERPVFDRYRELLLCMGSAVTYCGPVGAGNTVKLANQVIVAANIAALAEGLMLARRAGVEPETAFQAIRGGLAGSAVMEAKAPMMLRDDTKPGFRIELHIKDLTNAIEAGHETGAPLPVTAMVMEMLQNLRAAGMGQLDHSALAKYYERLAGDTLGGQGGETQ